MSALESCQSDRAAHGQVFTRRWVVDVILDLVGYSPDRDLSAMRLVEPACGAGSFVVAAVERLIASWNGRIPSIDQVMGAIRAYDLLEENADQTRRTVEHQLTLAGLANDHAHTVARNWISQGDYLLSDNSTLFATEQDDLADFVVGNPPYIRLEDVPDRRAKVYRTRWPTMLGRADIYVGFIECGLRSLKPDGKLGFICADRWTRNQYGAGLRQLVARNFSVDAMWAMHDVDAFESTVSAYPAISIISARPQGVAVAAETTPEFDEQSARQLVKWSGSSDKESTSGRGYRAHKLPHWFPGDEMWPTGTPERIALIEYLNDSFAPLEDRYLGTKVGIGVATGADRVFITENPDLVEEDRLLPIAMVSDIRSGSFDWGGRHLINPWNTDGSLVDLKEFPELRKYFLKNRAQLDGRHTARQNPARWYKTIDKVNHALVDREKLLIQDMRTSINPVLESGGHYPHHNLYYIVSDTWDMRVLGGLLLSRVAQAFIEAYCVRMRGNTLRFQSQYLRKIRVPAPDSISADVADQLRRAFDERDVHAATAAARIAYKIAPNTEL